MPTALREHLFHDLHDHRKGAGTVLGASTRRVRAYASGIDLPLNDAELRAWYTSMAAQGFSAGKLKIGLDREADMRRLGIMQQALATSGKRPELMVDINEYWSPKQAIRHLHYIEEAYDLVFVEEPARRWDWRGLRQVREGIRAAVATGENLKEVHEFVPLIHHEAVDIVQIGTGGASGITGSLQVADLAYAYNLPVSFINSPGNFMAHLAAALPNHLSMEVIAAGRDAVFTIDTRIEDGWVVLGDAPGLGVTFSAELLAQHGVDAPPKAGQAKAWGRRRGAGLYEVGPDEPPELDEE
ncbi:MAG: mandelate racemase/muconate lactonizing enzyme family protein [Bacillota bacterium]